MISEGTFWGTLHGFGCLRCVYACSDVERKCLCHVTDRMRIDFFLHHCEYKSFVFRGQTTIPDRPSHAITTRPMIYSHLRSTIRLSDHPTILPTDHPDGPSGRPTIRHVPAERPSDRPSHRPSHIHRLSDILRPSDQPTTDRPPDRPTIPRDHPTI